MSETGYELVNKEIDNNSSLAIVRVPNLNDPKYEEADSLEKHGFMVVDKSEDK